MNLKTQALFNPIEPCPPVMAEVGVGIDPSEPEWFKICWLNPYYGTVLYYEMGVN